MTDLEISKALALAIGWQPICVAPNPQGTAMYVNTSDNYTWDNRWQIFDYRDWNVIGPIAEKFDWFPSTGANGWLCGRFTWADTPQKAIALAVIQGAGHDQN